MKKFYLFLIGLSFLSLTACSSNEKSDEERAKEMAENLLEKATGQDVDIQTEEDEDGNVTNLSIKTEDGELNISGSEDKLPDDLPEVYIVDGKRGQIAVVSMGGKGKMVTFKVDTDKDVNTVKEEIKNNMSDWKNAMDMSTSEGSMLNFTKENNNTVQITISKEENKTVVGYMISYDIKEE